MARKDRPHNRVYKKQEATLYAYWRSMPFIFHELPLRKLQAMGYDVDNETFKKLLACKTKEQFRKAFHLAINTVVDWDANKEVQKMIDEFNKKTNVLKFKKDIDFHFTQATLKEADASRVKLWKQLYEGWQEKGGSSAESDSLNKIADSIREIAGAKPKRKRKKK